MSLTTSPTLLKLDLICAHIIEVVDHLYSDAIKETERNNDSIKPVAMSILLVSDSEIQAYLLNYFADKGQQVELTSLSISEFLGTGFNKRYSLGCFIDATNSTLNASDLDTVSNTQLSQQSYQNIAIRLRDLFAEQSLLLTTTPTAQLNFSSLGYTTLPLNTDDNTADLIIWQFNLYDYKQRPNWLNAKYWANPENFDKYRW